MHLPTPHLPTVHLPTVHLPTVHLATRILLVLAGWSMTASLRAQTSAYPVDVAAILERFCYECHEGGHAEAEIDLARFDSIDQVRSATKFWLRVRSMLASQQMPPPDSPQLTQQQHERLSGWVGELLRSEAAKHAGDPGPVTLRRLSNAEYTYSIRDLTGVDTLDPAKEFPVDGAAGEGFNNVGDALGMSPAMVTKYLDAAKGVSQHAVLTPNGIRFSHSQSDRDWTAAALDRVRTFYAQYADQGGQYLDWQGKHANSPRNGRIPLASYFDVLMANRDALRSESISIDDLARQDSLSPTYLEKLWSVLEDPQDHGLILNGIGRQWQSATDSSALVADIQRWQQSLWQFNSIGHLGRKGAPKRWMTPKDPLVERQRIRIDLSSPNGEGPVTLQLSALRLVGDDAVVAWRRPRIESPGRPPVLLRHAADVADKLAGQREQFLANLSSYLAAATQVGAGADQQQVASTAGINRSIFARLLSYLGIGSDDPATVAGHFSQTIDDVGGYRFVNGWGSPNTPSIVANSSDQAVRIPGRSNPHSMVVHPSPAQFAAVGWQSPESGAFDVSVQISDAHPECGNGVEWLLQHRRGGTSALIARGEIPTGGNKSVNHSGIDIRRGDVVSIIVGPRSGQHACDLTSVNLVLKQVAGDQQIWDLEKQVADRIQDGNPLADSNGNESVWHFYTGEMQTIGEATRSIIPAKSLLAQWNRETDERRRQQLADELQAVVQSDSSELDSANATVIDQLRKLVTSESMDPEHIVADDRYGSHPVSKQVSDRDLFVDLRTERSTTIEFQIPLELAREGRFVADVECDSKSNASAVQVSASQVGASQVSASQVGASLSPNETKSMIPGQPILVAAGSLQNGPLPDSLAQFRELFPAALCYTKIVPVDEVVTLQLYYREDQHFKRLMCDDRQAERLDQLWEELFYLAQEPLAALVALEQSLQFATQDRQDLVPEFDQLTTKYRRRAEAFEELLVRTEPIHLNSAVEFANRAWRRELTSVEEAGLRSTYAGLRQQKLTHDESIRLLITRILVAPSFLYRLEQPGPGSEAVDVSDVQLASRMSYFLWSTAPDSVLLDLAKRQELSQDRTIDAQVDRMLADHKTRRMAIHFACQWLHLRDFDQIVEKNERLYPEFAQRSKDLYEETIQFFTDMFRNDRSILDLIASDHTFVNQTVASHYGIDGVTGTQWQRVDGMRSIGRGGVLGMATVLASQSGASRTSPILRGNWVYETLLGQQLPKPPPGVPQLPEVVPAGKTARQLIELHSSAAQCAKCHRQIDPYGFALEQFDAIGRLRQTEADVKTTLPDGQSIEGIAGLRRYLMRDRADEIVHQFCRKLLGYALGREVKLSDEPLLERMQTQLRQHDYRFSIAVKSIVTSPQFRQIRGRLAADESFE